MFFKTLKIQLQESLLTIISWLSTIALAYVVGFSASLFEGVEPFILNTFSIPVEGAVIIALISVRILSTIRG